MKKASIIVHKNYIEDIIKNLYETGLIEIIDISKEQEETVSKKDIVSSEFDTCISYERRLSKLISILTKVKPKKGGIKGLLHPDLPDVKIIEGKALDELYSYTEGFLYEIEKNILQDEQEILKFDDEIERINFNIKQLNYIKDFDIDVSDIGTSEYLVVKAGRTTDLETIKTQIDVLENSLVFSKKFGTGKKVEWAIIVTTYIDNKERIEKIFGEKVSEFNFQQLSGSPKDIVKSLEKEKDEIDKEKKLIIKRLHNVADLYQSDFLALREELQLEIVKMDAFNNFAKTDYTYIINGWIVEKNQDILVESLTRVSEGHVMFNFESPSFNPDNPPTYFKTPKWASSFKMILETFALPKYNDINPMLFTGIFFIIFFGYMLGDAGYGLIILFLSLYGYLKIGKFSPMIKNYSFLGIWLGVTTTIVGFLTNGFFADFIPRFIYHNPNLPLYNVNIMGVNLPLDGLRNPIMLLSIGLILGLIQLNLGIFLGMCQLYRNKEFKTLILQYGSWIPLELGGGLLIGHLILDWNLETTIVNLSIIMTLLGIILLFIYTHGPLGFFSITGFVGDWLSYSRLVALGLSTAGMALAINLVGQLILQMIPIIGIIIFIIAMIILHIANLGMQSLGAAVHSLRLQYIEFFGRFYEGGGRAFTPFHINRVYTKTKEKM